MRAETIANEPEYVGRKFSRRFAPLAQSADGVHAASIPALCDHLVSLVDAGEMSAQKAERLAGFLLLGDRRGLRSRRTRFRRLKELRDHGLVLADPINDPIDVDLGEALYAALEAWDDA